MHDMSTIGLSLIVIFICNIDASDDLQNLHSQCMYMRIKRGRLKFAVPECMHKFKTNYQFLSAFSYTYRELKEYFNMH